jgi:glycosyltransferase involved in cell wall biosynthesis
VSVVMPVFNDSATLPAALDSILHQTFRDLEVVIIDDGSTDDTPELLRRYEEGDDRIRLIRNERNEGIARSLNRGIQEAGGALIARMDADDVSALYRIEKQVAYLREHDEVGVLGTQSRVVNERGEPLPRWTPALPVCHDLVVWQLFETTPIFHPSVVVRTDVVRAAGGYDDRLTHGEDMDLWTRLAFKTTFANLPEALLDYRVEEESYGSKVKSMAPGIQRTAHRYAEQILGRALSPELLRVHFEYTHQLRSRSATPAELIETSVLLAELFEAMCQQRILRQGSEGPVHHVMRQQVLRLVAAARAS